MSIVDPLSLFVAAAEASAEQSKAKETTPSQRLADTMSRIGASASDLFAESLSFTDPLSKNTPLTATYSLGSPSSSSVVAGDVLPLPPPPTSAPVVSVSIPSSSSSFLSPHPSMLLSVAESDMWDNATSSEQPSEPLPSLRSAVSHGDMHEMSSSSSSHAVYSHSLHKSYEGNTQAQSLLRDSKDSSALADKSFTALMDDVGGQELKFITGEQKLMNINDARIQLAPGRLISGVLMMTSYRVAFVPAPTHLAVIAATNPSIHSFLNLPLGCIERIEREKKSKDCRQNSSVTILISCKDMRIFRVTLMCDANGGMGEYELEKALRLLAASAFPNNRTLLFAFSHSLPSEPLSLSLVEPYDTVQEFSRMGILDVVSVRDDLPIWRITAVNNEYRLCNTYPKMLVVPRKISDDELVLVSHFRSGHRLPVMCWGDKETGATMWRSSQPKAGVSGSCIQDEKLLDLIAQSCVYKRSPTGVVKMSGDPLLHIIDCRAKASAMANRATGAGYESQTSYPNTRIEFCNIGNIHVMRDSLRSLAAVLLSPVPAGNDVDFSKQIETTQWLTHLRLVLKCSWDTAQMLRKGIPVLVHCSHGWDRTAQVCSIAQLFLDPFYRTFDGFKILVEKEWNSFGHQFPIRCAHGMDRSSRQDDQISPIFLQFLDCVWQIYKQFCHYFEFNARYLLTLADHIYSCRFGTFLFGSDLERDMNDSQHCCIDVWTYLHYNRGTLSNPLYMDPNLEHTPTTHTLLPPLTQLLRNVTLWTDYFFRWSALPSAVATPEPLSKYLYESGVSLAGNIQTPLASVVADMDVPAMVTSDDFWEAAYRRETLKSTDVSSSSSNTHNDASLQETIDRLVDMLHQKGANELEISEALRSNGHTITTPKNGNNKTTGKREEKFKKGGSSDEATTGIKTTGEHAGEITPGPPEETPLNVSVSHGHSRAGSIASELLSQLTYPCPEGQLDLFGSSDNQQGHEAGNSVIHDFF